MKNKVLGFTALLALTLGACGGSKDEAGTNGQGKGNTPAAAANELYGRWLVGSMLDNGAVITLSYEIEKDSLTTNVTCESNAGKGHASVKVPAKITDQEVQTLEEKSGGDEFCGITVPKRAMKYRLQGDSLQLTLEEGQAPRELKRMK